jgi:aminoacrylate hydrolase
MFPLGDYDAPRPLVVVHTGCGGSKCALGNFRRFDDAFNVKTLETSGVVLRYVREGSGVPVILVQGVGVIGEGWRPQIAALSDRYAIAAPDNRGIGGSALGSGALTIEDMAGDVIAIANAEGFERFHLAGHSMGGLIAQEVALCAPGRVRSLALLCTFFRGKEAARLTPDIMWTGLRTRVGTREMRRRAFMQLVMPDTYLRTAVPTLADDLAVLFGHDLADQPPIVMKQLRAASRYDASTRLEALTNIPTLVVSATHDRISLPKFGRALAHVIPGARYVEIPDAGHGCTIQCANRVNELLAEHFLCQRPTAQRSNDPTFQRSNDPRGVARTNR